MVCLLCFRLALLQYFTFKMILLTFSLTLFCHVLKRFVNLILSIPFSGTMDSLPVTWRLQSIYCARLCFICFSVFRILKSVSKLQRRQFVSALSIAILYRIAYLLVVQLLSYI